MFYEAERTAELHTSEDGIETLLICDGDESAVIALGDLPEDVRETLRAADSKLEADLEDLRDHGRELVESHYESVRAFIAGLQRNSDSGKQDDTVTQIAAQQRPTPGIDSNKINKLRRGTFGESLSSTSANIIKNKRLCYFQA